MSILNKLDGARVIDVEMDVSRKFITITEKCDQWYYSELYKSEILFLIKELQALHDEML